MFPISFVCTLKLKYYQYRPFVHEQKRIFYFYFLKNSSKVLVLNLTHTLKNGRFSSNLTTQKYHNMDHLYMLYKYETMFFLELHLLKMMICIPRSFFLCPPFSLLTLLFLGMHHPSLVPQSFYSCYIKTRTSGNS